MKSKGNKLFFFLSFLLILLFFLFGLFVSYETNNNNKNYTEPEGGIKEITIDNPTYEF